MARVLFLSEATLKTESVLQDNVDMKVVTPTIFDVQSMYILPIMGTALYNDISAKIAAATLSSDEINLMDLYVTPTMIWWMRYELPMVMNYKYFNKSVGTMNSDNMTPLSESEMFKLMDHTKNKAEWYSERLTKYLLQNNLIFPLYLNQTKVGIDTIFAKRTNFNSGMVLHNDNCCAGKYNFQNIPIAPAEIRVHCSICD